MPFSARLRILACRTRHWPTEKMRHFTFQLGNNGTYSVSVVIVNSAYADGMSLRQCAQLLSVLLKAISHCSFARSPISWWSSLADAADKCGLDVCCMQENFIGFLLPLPNGINTYIVPISLRRISPAHRWNIRNNMFSSHNFPFVFHSNSIESVYISNVHARCGNINGIESIETLVWAEKCGRW